MKTRISKDIIIFLVLIPVFLGLAFRLSSRMENRLPAYSVINKSALGYSVVYEALKELKYPVERALKPLWEIDKSSLQLVVRGSGFDINSNEVKAWVEQGGTLIYLAPANFHAVLYGVKPEVKGSFVYYKYNKGMVVAADSEIISNKRLLKGTEGAYELLQLIGSLDYSKLYFNEVHLFSEANKKTLWDYLSMEVKLIVYQLLLIIAALIYYKGKRFGKVIAFYEEVERPENEYLHSAASLYRQSRCWDLMVESYYKSFLVSINCTHDNWLDYWQQESLPSFSRAKRVYEFMHKEKTKVGKKEYMQIVSLLEQLKKIANKRREEYWKTLKRTR